MAKPEGEERVVDRARVSLGTALAALAAVAALAVCVACLDTRHRYQLTDLRDQVGSLKQLVEDMRRQLDLHELAINSSLSIQPKTRVRTEAAEEVYEEEYEYDNEDGSYEYDETDEPEKKPTVKRTTILSESLISKQTEETRNRSKREVRDPVVPVVDERYVSSTAQLNTLHSRGKSEGLRIYATYFGNPQTVLRSRNQIHHDIRHSFDSVENYNRPPPNNEKQNQRSHHFHSLGYQELRRPTESTVRLRHHRNGIGGVEVLAQNKDENLLHFQRQTEKEFDVLAAHFVGDTSAYSNKDHHPVYRGNHILHHNVFKDWIPAKWMYEFNLHYEFPLEDGKVVIRNPGLYLIYAQIYYASSHDRCGFHVRHNETEVAQCMTTTIGRHIEKRNTCFTAIVLHLSQFDRIWIKEVEGNRNTSFKSFHSFFGLVHLKSMR